MKAKLAEVYDNFPMEFWDDWTEEERDAHTYDRPFHVQLDGVWQTVSFKRRCDAARWAGRRAKEVKHWYTI